MLWMYLFGFVFVAVGLKRCSSLLLTLSLYFSSLWCGKLFERNHTETL